MPNTPAATPPAKEISDHLEKDLAHLINVSGKLRMLSHQVVMCALLHETLGKTISFPHKLSEALDEFKSITAALTGSGASADLGPDTQRLLHSGTVVSDHHRDTLTAFIERANALKTRPSVAEAAALGEFVAGEVLMALNQINANIRQTLDDTIAEKRKAQEPLLRAASTSLDEINRLSKTLQLVAMNASLEAQRAGEHGAAFGEIAREMRGLSLKSMDQAKRLEHDLSHFKASQTTATGRPVTP